MRTVFKGLRSLPRVRLVRIPRRVRHVLTSASVLIIFLSGAGLAYTWYTDGNSQQTVVTPAASSTAYTPIAPKQPAANANEGVSVEMLTSPVAPGSEAEISVRTNPTSQCKIAVIYGYDPSKKQSAVSDPALLPQTADAYGGVSWTWSVSPEAKHGKGNVTVTCTYHGRTGVVQGDLDITV